MTDCSQVLRPVPPGRHMLGQVVMVAPPSLRSHARMIGVPISVKYVGIGMSSGRGGGGGGGVNATGMLSHGSNPATLLTSLEQMTCLPRGPCEQM